MNQLLLVLMLAFSVLWDQVQWGWVRSLGAAWWKHPRWVRQGCLVGDVWLG